MSCVCRTTSFKIFVQSLTGLRFADHVRSRFARLNHLSSPVAIRQALVRHPARLYSSTSAARSSTPPWRDNPDVLSIGEVEKEASFSFSSVDGAAKPTTDDSGNPPPSAFSEDLIAAKLNGVILDYTPESIDTLVAGLDRNSMAEREATLEHDNDDSDVPSRSRSRPKPPIISSQLKRRKIIKNDARPKPDTTESRADKIEGWRIQKEALKEKFPEGWRPRKRLSPDAVEGIRALHAQYPAQYTTEVLANNFEVSPEAVRRILRSKWTPNPEEEISRQDRWFNRGKNIWSQMAALGKKPPRRWRREGIVREPHWNHKTGPRTEYPYMPRREQPEAQEPAESVQRKLSSNLL
ncbi:hypothetical protein F5Y14DRAFT_402658 [Nemania sp. NC0429]|nr:hypothetical protein F5Y14DRAFT_402658 [Nemania sp. NC0429]